MSKYHIHIDSDPLAQQCSFDITGTTTKTANMLVSVGMENERFRTALRLAAKYLDDHEAQVETEAFMAEVEDILQNHKPSKN